MKRAALPEEKKRRFLFANIGPKKWDNKILLGGLRKGEKGGEQFGKGGGDGRGEPDAGCDPGGLHTEQPQGRQQAEFVTKPQRGEDAGSVPGQGQCRIDGKKVGKSEAHNGTGRFAHVDGVDEDDPLRPFEQFQQGQATGTTINRLDSGGRLHLPQALDGDDAEAVIPHQRVADANDPKQRPPAADGSSN